MATKPLTASVVFVRIRPTTTTGDCGHTDGEAVRKKLDGWDATSVTIQDDDLRQKTRFSVTEVLPPETDQEDVFAKMSPELLEAFWTDSNVLFFAYGQTGSGKTHTMLGEIESLSSADPVPGWGLFPRVVHSTLESMKAWRAAGTHSVLLASAVEFYCGCAFDLNGQGGAKNEVTIDRDAQLLGTRSKEITSTRQLKKWITRMYANRTTAKTKMNDASSRSHCAFVLTLHQLRADNTYAKTTFSMVDMAGSERVAKAGGTRVSGIQAGFEAQKMMEEGTPEKLSIGAQGMMINGELSLVATEILKASDVHKKGMPYKAAKEMSTAASFYFCACCDGRARLGACVTISQSPQHGFESWFSLGFAEQLASCRVPLRRVEPVPMDRALQDAKARADDAAANFAKINPNPQGAKQWRVYSMVIGNSTHTAETLTFLQRLADERSGAAPPVVDDGAEESSDGSEIFARAFPGKKRAKVIKKSAIEMGKINENFSVFIRIRPLLDREIRSGARNCFVVSDVDFPRDPPPQRITVQDSSEPSARGSYVFNRVFDGSHGQEEVYAATAKPYVADFLGGTNVTIFAYGQTGTGKTHTIAGPKEDPGVMSRCLSDIFGGLPATGLELWYEYVQLYLDDFKDLLEGRSSDLKLVDGKDGNVRLQSVTSRRATSREEVLAAVEAGAARRATRAQDMNMVSSRSHAILMLRLVEPGDDASSPKASMFVVDLAGSERVARSGVTGQGFDEATNINQSLSSLGRVVITLIQNESSGGSFVPYNASPLTSVLKAGLGGNSKTALIACVTQAADSISESVSTLRFAMQASHVKNKVEKKEARDGTDLEKEKIADSGNLLTLQDGQGSVPLASGPLAVWGSWDPAIGAAGRTVILLTGPGGEPSSMRSLIDKLAGKDCQVLAPKLRGTSIKQVEEDVKILLELLDWLGVAKPLLYGRDWGAIRAIKFKACHPKRATQLVLENFGGKYNEAEYKAQIKKDPTMVGDFEAFLWLFDGTFPKTGDCAPGSNMKGFKAKVSFLWPCHNAGRPDPKRKGWMAKAAVMFAKVLKTEVIDTYLMDEDGRVDHIASFLS